MALLPAVLARVDHALRGDGFRTGAVLHCWHRRTATAAEIVGLVCES